MAEPPRSSPSRASQKGRELNALARPPVVVGVGLSRTASPVAATDRLPRSRMNDSSAVSPMRLAARVCGRAVVLIQKPGYIRKHQDRAQSNSEFEYRRQSIVFESQQDVVEIRNGEHKDADYQLLHDLAKFAPFQVGLVACVRATREREQKHHEKSHENA